MSALELLAKLKARGITLEPHGDTLRASGPLTDETRGLIRQHKPALLSYLTMPPAIAGAYEAGEWLSYKVERGWQVYSPLYALLETVPCRNRAELLAAIDRAKAGDLQALSALRAFAELPQIQEHLKAVREAREVAERGVHCHRMTGAQLPRPMGSLATREGTNGTT